MTRIVARSIGMPARAPALAREGPRDRDAGHEPDRDAEHAPDGREEERGCRGHQRRVPRVAPRAASVAWSVCCSASVSAVEVRVMTRISRAKTPRRTATTMASSRVKPFSTVMPRPRRRAPPAAAPPRRSGTAAPEASRRVVAVGAQWPAGRHGGVGCQHQGGPQHPRVRVSGRREGDDGYVDLLLDLDAGVGGLGRLRVDDVGARASVTLPSVAAVGGSPRTTAAPSRTAAAWAGSRPRRRTTSAAGSTITWPLPLALVPATMHGGPCWASASGGGLPLQVLHGALGGAAARDDVEEPTS